MTTATLGTIATALAARFAAGALTAPSGYATIRSSTANLPNAIGPTPAVMVFVNSGTFETGNGTRVARQSWSVRFYLDRANDLERQEVALRSWASVLVDQLRDAVQLGGIVDRCAISGWRIGVLTYSGVEFVGVELDIETATSEGWATTA